MGYKIFISYKYGDTNVRPLSKQTMHTSLCTISQHIPTILGHSPTTVRNYVTELQNKLSDSHVNKGEKDNESLAQFKNSTIASKLRDKIFDSSITIVIISPNMKDPYLTEQDQWIPWEISYSLCEYGRNGRTSHSNAVLAVVLPDFYNDYSYYMEENSYMDDKTFCRRYYTLLKTTSLFSILSKNMFNSIAPQKHFVPGIGDLYTGEHSYILSAKWDDFIKNPNQYIDRAIKIRQNINMYNITKTI